MGVSDKVNQAKSWFQSKTIIGTILALIPTIARIISPDLEVDAVGAVEEAWAGAEFIANYADSTWADVQEVFGAVLAIYGRIKAKVGIK